ncbi:hypothetical protein ABT314_29515, partial [Streptomyces spiralis]
MATATMHVSESARAASAAESRFRIDVPIAPARAARVVALDERTPSVAGWVSRARKGSSPMWPEPMFS